VERNLRNDIYDFSAAAALAAAAADAATFTQRKHGRCFYLK